MRYVSATLLCFLLGASVARAQLIVPEDFPGITVETYGEVAPGSLFLSVSADVEGTGFYVMILDNEGRPLRYRKLPDDYAYDFKRQPNGLFSYAQFISHHSYTGGGNCVHILLDQEMNVIDSIRMKNGYVAEAHDFQLLPNGHALMIGYYMTQADLSERVEGGYPDARVSGGIIQELDDRGEVIFQWRSWDHFDMDTYEFRRGSNRQEVSAFHLNTINMDSDGHLLLATPKWVRKISRQTGEVLWTLGGEENDFSFTGVDSLTGLDQATGHAFYRFDDGNYLVYNNGGRMHDQDNSSVHEFRLDQDNRVAELVWSYHPDRPIPAWHRGNAFRLPNGNTLIGWGGASGSSIPVCTEVDSGGRVVMEAFFTEPFMESYRAFRHELGETFLWRDTLQGVEAGTTYSVIHQDSGLLGYEIEVDTLWKPDAGTPVLYTEGLDRAPLYPYFHGKDPGVVPVTIILETLGTGFEGTVRFTPSEYLQIRTSDQEPGQWTIYFRRVGGDDAFLPLSTAYDAATHTLSSPITMEPEERMEVILGYPDLSYMAMQPSCVAPSGGSIMNREEPVQLEWAPEGIFTWFRLQIASDSLFQSVLLEADSIRTTLHTYHPDKEGEYFWRVKTFTLESEEVLESEWSVPSSFITGSPYLELLSPAGAEQWQQGEAYFIQWKDNLSQNVKIELYSNRQRVAELAVTESDGAWKWKIPDDLEIGCTYQVKISNSGQTSQESSQGGYFSVVDSTGKDGCGLGVGWKTEQDLRIDLIPEPSSSRIRIQLHSTEPEVVRVRLFNILGQPVATPDQLKIPEGKTSLAVDMPVKSERIYIVVVEMAGNRWYRKVFL